jgi:hypothetical protein
MRPIDANRYCATSEGDVTILTARFWDNAAEHKLGHFLTDDDYDVLVDEDCDFYAPSFGCGDVGCAGPCTNGEHNIIFKLRRHIFTQSEQQGAYEGLVDAARASFNRGLAAGPKGEKNRDRDWATEQQFAILDYLIDRPTNTLYDNASELDKLITDFPNKETTRGMVWLRSRITDAGYHYESFFRDKLDEWKRMTPQEAAKDAALVKKTFISHTTYANGVLSGIAGFYDRYPRIPYGRATSYTEQNREQYELCYPFMIKLADQFKQLLPKRFAAQEECANQLDPRFRVAGKKTPFTTITVNKNFRTAAHRDAGDLGDGFSNLTVVAKDKNWSGGYLVLPEFRVAINIRPGDLLLINNHQGIHGNTEIMPPAGKKLEDMERISLVCYFREKMLELGSWEYERARYDFVESRRMNKQHALWRPLWNGVSEGMWDSQEWYQYLHDQLGEDVLHQYHPNSIQETTLEGFF